MRAQYGGREISESGFAGFMDYQDQERSAPNGLNPANPLILIILILTNYSKWVGVRVEALSRAVPKSIRHSRGNGNPGSVVFEMFRIPAFAGMTVRGERPPSRTLKRL